MATIGANLVVWGIIWTSLFGVGGFLVVKNPKGAIAGTPGAVMVFIGAVMIGLSR